MRQIIWLASYPKCGNTWLRFLLLNLGKNEEVDINAPPEREPLASSRSWFEASTLLPSGLLTHDEIDRLRAAVYRSSPPGKAEGNDAPRFIKTHDAWSLVDGAPLMAAPPTVRGAVLIVRDPRDVAASLAHHNRDTVDAAIAMMADPTSELCGRSDRHHNQLRQHLGGWSGFATSWLDQDTIPIHLVRYEDIIADAPGSLERVLAFAGQPASAAACAEAALLSSFERMRDQERQRGFDEAPPATDRSAFPFFRQGRAGGWQWELTDLQAQRVIADHGVTMRRLGYETDKQEKTLCSK